VYVQSLIHRGRAYRFGSLLAVRHITLICPDLIEIKVRARRAANCG
jgi:hypothetical protein